MQFLKKMFGLSSAKKNSSLDVILRRFAEFYFEKNEFNLTEATDEIRRLGIKDIQLNESDELVIHLSRPGILIGRYGKNINDLHDYLKIGLRIVESEGVSDRLQTMLSVLDDEKDLYESHSEAVG
jgi:hypothetical protein